MKTFIKKGNYLIVDFNPGRVQRLKNKRINCIYGDASNIELLDELKVERAKVIVSTIPERETNLLLLKKIREKNDKTIVIVTSRQQISDTLELYKAGADYVILPHYIGGEYTSKIIETAGLNKAAYEKVRKEQIKQLKERLR